MVKSLLRWPCLGTSTSIWNNLKVVLQPIKAKVMLLLWCYKSLNIKNYSFPKINLFREEKTIIKFGLSQIWCKNCNLWDLPVSPQKFELFEAKKSFCTLLQKKVKRFSIKKFWFLKPIKMKNFCHPLLSYLERRIAGERNVAGFCVRCFTWSFLSIIKGYI